MKVLGLEKIVWLVIFFILQIFNFAFLVGAMNYNQWFHQRWISGGHYYNFNGSLLGPSSDYYALCNTDDTYEDCYNNCPSYCSQYKNWYGAGVGYVFLDTIASVISVIIAVMIVLEFLKVQFLRKFINLFTTSILMFAIAGIHLLAFIIWAGAAQLRFDSCSHQYPFNGNETVCGDGGAAFALWNVFFFVFTSVPYFIIVRKIREEEANESGSQEPLTE